MNWWLIPTLGLASLLYWLGTLLARKPRLRFAVGAFSLALGLPALIYVFHYSKLLGEPIWLYRLRAIPGTEMLAGGLGLFAGWTQAVTVPRLGLSRLGRSILTPFMLGFVLVVPYLKPVMRPLAVEAIDGRWEEDVCRQTTPSTCGPACAATLLRRFGLPGGERELAREAFSSATGTENWYLVRALRRRGLYVEAVKSDPRQVTLPAIAGVRLNNGLGAGHFIVVLERRGSDLVVGDPIVGKQALSPEEVAANYQFTGFFITVAQAQGRRQAAE